MLDNAARMNFPGKASGYWQWRFTPEMLTGEMQKRLVELYGRLPQTETTEAAETDEP